jgi:hypothetical protein
MGFNIVTKNNVRERFFSPARPEIWKDSPDSDWNNWIWQQQKRIKTMDVLEKVLKVTQDEHDAFAKSHEQFNMGITPYYASLMDPNDPNCPIRIQSVPKMGELTILPMDMEDPLAEERDMPVPGITHRYPDRVLFYTTHNSIRRIIARFIAATAHESGRFRILRRRRRTSSWKTGWRTSRRTKKSATL